MDCKKQFGIQSRRSKGQSPGGIPRGVSGAANSYSVYSTELIPGQQHCLRCFPRPKATKNNRQGSDDKTKGEAKRTHVYGIRCPVVALPAWVFLWVSNSGDSIQHLVKIVNGDTVLQLPKQHETLQLPWMRVNRLRFLESPDMLPFDRVQMVLDDVEDDAILK